MDIIRGTQIKFITDFSKPDDTTEGEVINTYCDGIHEVLVIDKKTKYTRFVDVYDRQIKEIVKY